MRQLALLPCALALALATPAAAQTDDGKPTQSEKCRAEPDAQQNGQAPSANGQEGGQDTDSLTETLDDCGGVLKPPPTGDQDMTAPAPDEGKTPVIKPGEVPAQPPTQD